MSKRPPTMADRARLAGLTILQDRGPSYLAEIGARGQDALSARIARDAGLDPAATDYPVRLEAARRLYFSRLRKRRPETVT